MQKKANFILAIASVIVYIIVVIMKFFTQINIPDSSFVCITLLFIISARQFISALKSSESK